MASNGQVNAGMCANLAQGGDLDPLLDGMALTGVLLSLVMVTRGAANLPLLATLWLLYISLVNVGQTWFSFGWESQLLETGQPVLCSTNVVCRVPGHVVCATGQPGSSTWPPGLPLAGCLGVQVAGGQDHAGGRAHQGGSPTPPLSPLNVSIVMRRLSDLVTARFAETNAGGT